MKKVKSMWLLYDGRYLTDKDRATCYEVCKSLREAVKNKYNYGNDTVIVKVDVDGKQLINPRIIHQN